MTQTAHLFVGGSKDGQWLMVDTNLDIVTSEVTHNHAILDFLFPARSETYFRYQIPASSTLYTVFAISHMNLDEVVAWLLAGYNRPSETI